MATFKVQVERTISHEEIGYVAVEADDFDAACVLVQAMGQDEINERVDGTYESGLEDPSFGEWECVNEDYDG